MPEYSIVSCHVNSDVPDYLIVPTASIKDDGAVVCRLYRRWDPMSPVEQYASVIHAPERTFSWNFSRLRHITQWPYKPTFLYSIGLAIAKHFAHLCHTKIFLKVPFVFFFSHSRRCQVSIDVKLFLWHITHPVAPFVHSEFDSPHISYLSHCYSPLITWPLLPCYFTSSHRDL